MYNRDISQLGSTRICETSEHKNKFKWLKNKLVEMNQQKQILYFTSNPRINCRVVPNDDTEN